MADILKYLVQGRVGGGGVKMLVYALISPLTLYVGNVSSWAVPKPKDNVML